MRKTILRHLNVLLGSMIVGLTGLMTSCYWFATEYGVQEPGIYEPDPKVIPLYGVPSSNMEATFEMQEAEDPETQGTN